MEQKDFIQRALQETMDTKAVLIEKGALKKVPQVYKQLFGDKKAIIVTDKRNEIFATEVDSYMRNEGIVMEDMYIFDHPKFFANWTFIEQLEKDLIDKEAIAIGIGAGVINDLIKLASEHLGRQYMIVATAASMDGYTAYGASITYEGNKQNFDCKAPLGVVFDPEVAVNSRAGQSASGYADLLAKVTAGADWIIADALGIDKIDIFAFNLVQKRLKDSLSEPEKVAKADVDAIQRLAEGLLMSGFAMQACHSSRPSSGLEHLFSHYWDMEGLTHNGKHISHGFMVGIGTLVSTACLEFILSYDMKSIDPDALSKKWQTCDEQIAHINRIFHDMPAHLKRALEESKKKYPSPEQIRRELTRLVNSWDKLKLKLEKQIFSYEEVYEKLSLVGAKTKPEDIGVSREKLKNTLLAMPFMRDRYTNIDLIYRAGLMDNLIEHLFGKNGIWEI